MMKNILLVVSLVLLSSATSHIGEALSSPKTQYTVLSQLNEGAFSDIFEVKDLSEQIYALKSYKTTKNPHKSLFSYFFGDPEREYKVGTTLNHPSIIQAIEQWDRYLILEHVKGRSLCTFNKSSLTEAQAVSISLQLIDALKHAFCNQYCNINPQARNVLINEDFSVKIVDLAFFISFQDLKKHFKIDGSDTELTYIWLKHFNLLTELCVQIFDKAPLLREDRIEKRLAIKQLIWDLVEDFEENQDVQFEDAFDLLSEKISSFV
jgi:serine/threonine protein kinase